MEIKTQGCMNPKNIHNIAKIHHVKYITEEKKEKFHVWQYYGIGEGKKYPVGKLPETPSYTVTVPFQEGHSFGNAMVTKSQRKEGIFHAEPMCQMSLV